MVAKCKSLTTKASIKSVAVHFPENLVHNSDLVGRINYDSPAIKNGALERLLGVKTRHFASDETQVSDLACSAAKKILDKYPNTKIDLLIFAAASSDLIEPATANIVQAKLGLTCPVMDIKNACSSFVSAMQVASAFIDGGVYEHVLIVNGEKLSEVINFSPRSDDHLTRCLASYGLGDAGAAILMSPDAESKIVYQKFCSWGEYWNLCTVEGGGSMAFRDADKYYFESDSRELRNIFSSKIPAFVTECFDEAGWTIDDIDCMITHQVSSSTITEIAVGLGIPVSKCVNTFNRYGNTAAATIPIALHDSIADGRLKKGDKLCIMGLAAGISLSVQLVEW
jgi:3-oxoacyl-(acyl-carrier-protein) synthase III